MLFHGQSKVERNFSVNENSLVYNMQMDTIVAQRKFNDNMRKNNFQPHDVPMSKALLQNAKQAHFEFKKVLDEKQKQKNKESVGAIKIEKEIAGLNAQKSQLELAIEEYEKDVDKCAFEVENKENLELWKLSNSLKHACKENRKNLMNV